MGCSSSQPQYKPGVPISQIQSQIQPLDLIVFRGNGVTSDVISLAEKLYLGSGDWSHVGIVITSDIVPIANAQPNRLYLWESTTPSFTRPVNSIETGQPTYGVQIRDLEEVINNYDLELDSRTGWCQLINNPYLQINNESSETFSERRKAISNLLNEFYQRYGQQGYDYNCLNLCSPFCYTGADKFRQICGQSDRMFCSELVVSIYQKLGILKSDLNPETIAPVGLVGYAGPDNSLTCPVKIPPVIITRNWESTSVTL